MAVPPDVASITSIDDWASMWTLLHLLRRRDLSLLSVWHPFVRSCCATASGEIGRVVAPRRLTGGARHPPDCRRRRGPRPCTTAPRPCQRTAAGGTVTSPESGRPKRRELLGRRQRRGRRGCNFTGEIRTAVLQPGPPGLEGVVSIPCGGLHPLAVRSHFLEFERRWRRRASPRTCWSASGTPCC